MGIAKDGTHKDSYTRGMVARVIDTTPVTRHREARRRRREALAG